MSNSTHQIINDDWWRNAWAEVDAYDALPKELREKIANCNVTVSSKTVLQLWGATRNISMCEKAIDQMAEMLEKDLIK